MSPATDKLAYNITDAARALSVSTDTLYRRIKDGDLKVVKIGARTVIRRVELEAYLERLQNAA